MPVRGAANGVRGRSSAVARQAECGIYKSTDGGDTWTHLSKGLPLGLIGKVDIDISASEPTACLRDYGSV
jgi:hypothetical protein